MLIPSSAFAETGIKPAMHDKHGPGFKKSDVEKVIVKMINSDQYFKEQAKHMSTDTEKAIELNWVNTSDSLPSYGAPVLIIIGNTVQHITYCLDGDDSVPDWFEPYYFDHDDELKIMHNKVKGWAYLPERT